MMLDERKFRAIGFLVTRLARGIASDVTTAANDVIDIAPLVPVWKPGAWEKDSVVTHEGYPYKTLQAHDSTQSPSWTPEAMPSLFAPFHATDRAHALDYRAPSHAGDAYNEGEWMIWEGQYYRCLANATIHAPDVLPSAWELSE